jgi:peptidyl-prolyl cis-trans isomerase B (cyclophilin B)|tara:strand:+ start:1571 stop:2149 length:579 start_codon:yes stop_codon:yes gene_type:complete
MKNIIKYLVITTIIFLNSGANAEMTTNTKIIIKTTSGDIKIELYDDKAPITSENFKKYIESGYFTDTIFHRVIKGFMIQGGGFTAEMSEKDSMPPIQNEANNGVSNARGTIAMARTPDPHSASSQFFINLKDNNFLDFTAETSQGWGYCAFGKVFEGMDILDKIALVDTGSYGAHQDVPKEPITINEIIIEK